MRPLDIKKEPTQPYLQGQIGNLFGAGDVLLQRVPQGSIGIHKIKVYKAESAVYASIGLHRLTRKETLGETLSQLHLLLQGSLQGFIYNKKRELFV